MIRKFSFLSIVAVFIDCLGALVLALYALLLGPLGILRGPLAFERLIWYLSVFIPARVLSRSIRMAIEWRLGHFDVAITQAQNLISTIEQHYRKKPNSHIRQRVLADLYTLLARAFMHAGHIDEAMQVIIKAKKELNLDRLAGLSELDAKTAHLVRAGIAAGRLLDGGGLATMFIKTDPTGAETLSSSNNQQPQSKHSEPQSDSKQGKIIPFPVNDFV